MNKEQRYNQHIEPLVKEVARKCKEHKIPAIMYFEIPNETRNQYAMHSMKRREYNPSDNLYMGLMVLRGDIKNWQDWCAAVGAIKEIRNAP